jgi:hypothetical protein
MFMAYTIFDSRILFDLIPTFHQFFAGPFTSCPHLDTDLGQRHILDIEHDEGPALAPLLQGHAVRLVLLPVLALAFLIRVKLYSAVLLGAK